MESSEIIAICASGPSLCADDTDYLLDFNIPIITINSSWMMVPECQFVFSTDAAWWQQNYLYIPSSLQRWTSSEIAAKNFGLNYFENKIPGTFNSGMVAISFAINLGFEKIILLGYDCSLKNGVHWHGRHKGINNPNPYSVSRWRNEFEKLALEIKNDVAVINCSRESCLTCFPMETLVNVLGMLIPKSLSI